MSLFSRALMRMQPRILGGLNNVHGTMAPSSRALTRSLVVLCNNGSRRISQRDFPASTLCSCGCGIHGMHTRGDRELVEFLQEEIVAEKKNVASGLPSHLDEFAIKACDAELTLTKTFHDEQVTVSLNVNHTVDTEGPVEGAHEEANLKSRPSFEVDIKVGSKTMSFTCSFTNAGETVHEDDRGHNDDVFGINELTFYEGEWSEDTYCVSGDILDEMMYDILMNMLEERGVSNEFAEKLSYLCSSYEHSLYVSLLQNVQDFVKRK